MRNEFHEIPKKWLITGGCGFIGTNLIDCLIKYKEVKIRVIDDLSVGKKENLESICPFEESRIPLNEIDKRVQLWREDILNEKMAIKATEGIDCIVHLAANTGVIPSIENPRQDCITNVLGTLNYLEGARINNVNKFIFASSGAPLGEQEPPIHELKVPKPLSPYGASKLAGEGYCSAYYGAFGIHTIILRFGNVYGPRSTHKGSVIAKFIRQAIDGETLVIYGDGEQTRDFIYTDDLVHAIIKISKINIGGEIFQIATNIETPINDIVMLLENILSTQYGMKVYSHYKNARRGEIIRNYSDISKAFRILGWQPHVGLDEGLQKTVDWFIGHIGGH